jgi:ZIP family zinc transporter
VIAGLDQVATEKKNLLRLGIFTAIAISLHNFPEGLATFLATLEEPNVGIAIAVAIAIHNIPEGIAVAIPIFFATNSKKKAIFWAFLSGIAEPVGALVGVAILWPFINDYTFGFLFAGVAGIMVYISLDELLPAAERYGEHHISILGLVSGMMIMALSLVLL